MYRIKDHSRQRIKEYKSGSDRPTQVEGQALITLPVIIEQSFFYFTRGSSVPSQQQCNGRYINILQACRKNV